MFRQDDEPCVWPGTQRQGDLARQAKAWTAIRNPDQVITEAVPRLCLAIRCAGEVIRRIGMRVIDMCERQEPMQKGLDGGTRAARLREAVSKVVHHLGVAHPLTF